jgi:hypothetical protein
MTLKQQILADATTVFLNTTEFAESVAYRSLGAGVPRTISAVVFREALSGSEESGGAVTPLFEVHVANSATTGISSTEIDLGGDTLTFAVRDGLAVSQRRIVAIVTQDEAMLVLQCL